MFWATLSIAGRFSQIEGVQEAAEITHNWYYQGSLKASVVLPVHASGLR